MNRVLMLGWEYPPHISGGLGTACEGLTKGLSRQGTDITFVVPKLLGGEDNSHMQIMDSYTPTAGTILQTSEESDSGHGVVEQHEVPAFLQPYWTEETYTEYLQTIGENASLLETLAQALPPKSSGKEQYGRNIFEEVARYTQRTVSQFKSYEFNVIHAHDWMTYPAGIALRNSTGKPLIVHVHSLEYDRSGTSVNTKIHALERAGLEAADAVIAVSEYTRSIINREHGIPLEKIHVVHNGIYPSEALSEYRAEKEEEIKTVLFLGRITFQKGPDYFVRAAAKVLEHLPKTQFVLAGSGDMLPRMIELAHDLGIERNFSFPGFLRNKEVERMYSQADLYVMPSVSEPFGISALEAINFDIPVIMSKQSGVSEVVGHALKFDFWDIDRFADLMINSLLHDDMREDMISMAKEELRKIRWDAAAEKTVKVYQHIHSQHCSA